MAERRPSSRLLLRKRSSSAAEERQEVLSAVAAELASRQTPLARRHSAYAPPPSSRRDTTTKSRSDDLRVATTTVNTIYAIHQQYERRRRLDNAAIALALAGIGIVFVDNEYATTAATKTALRGANAVLTLILLGLLLGRFVVEREILIKRNVLPPNVSIWRMRAQLLQLLMEVVVCAVCIPPGVGVGATIEVWEWRFYVASGTTCATPLTSAAGSCYLVYSYPIEVLGLLSLLRLYMLPRLILNLSDFNNYRTSYLGALHHVDTLRPLFAVKCFLQAHPFAVFAVAFVGTLVLTSYTLAIVEAPVNPEVAPLWNAMWLVVLTMGTIGYGDLTAETLVGQTVLIVGAMLTGILLFGILNAAVIGFLKVDEKDRRLLYLLRRQQYNQELKNACARSIQTAWGRYRTRSSSGYRDRANQTVLYQRLAHQRALRKNGIEDFASTSMEVQRCQDQLVASLKDDHLVTLKKLRLIEQRLDRLLTATTDAVASVA